MPLADTITFAPLRVLSALDSSTLDTVRTRVSMRSSAAASRRCSPMWSRYSAVTRAAIGLLR